MNKYILIDSGYWFGLLDKKDEYHELSQTIAGLIGNHILIVPFPSMYEVLNSKFVGDKERLNKLEKIMNSDLVKFIHDDKYREQALINTYEIHRKISPKLSLVDSIIREIIMDINVKIDYVVTFNEKDFRDVCDIRKIGIIND